MKDTISYFFNLPSFIQNETYLLHIVSENNFSEKQIFQAVEEVADSEQEQRKILQSFDIPAWSDPIETKDQEEKEYGREEFRELSKEISNLLTSKLKKLKEETSDVEKQKLIEEQISLIKYRKDKEELLRSKIVRENPNAIPSGTGPAKLVELSDTIIPAVYKGDQKEGKKEWLAGQIDKVLGLDIVPPTVMLDEEAPDGVGSAQQFSIGRLGHKKLIAETIDNLSAKFLENVSRERLETIIVFDELIKNDDRTAGNWIKQPDGDVSAIDHGFCFSGNSSLLEDTSLDLSIPDKVRKKS